ncbi:hypothetical protein CGRA01v4_06808 [Colletotrichum graminicola]|nr:hypothetical protein CGRA01v4_06808 [Colletotrichum graminicola]
MPPTRQGGNQKLYLLRNNERGQCTGTRVYVWNEGEQQPCRRRRLRWAFE